MFLSFVKKKINSAMTDVCKNTSEEVFLCNSYFILCKLKSEKHKCVNLCVCLCVGMSQFDPTNSSSEHNRISRVGGA